MRALFNRPDGATTLTSYVALGLFLVVALSQSYGLRFVVADLLRPDQYAKDHFSLLLAQLRPLRDQAPAGSEVYLVKSFEDEVVNDIPLKLSALQHTFAPRLIRGVIWRPARPFDMTTRVAIENRGILLQELHRFSDGGLVLCSCKP